MPYFHLLALHAEDGDADIVPHIQLSPGFRASMSMAFLAGRECGGTLSLAYFLRMGKSELQRSDQIRRPFFSVARPSGSPFHVSRAMPDSPAPSGTGASAVRP